MTPSRRSRIVSSGDILQPTSDGTPKMSIETHWLADLLRYERIRRRARSAAIPPRCIPERATTSRRSPRTPETKRVPPEMADECLGLLPAHRAARELLARLCQPSLADQ